MSRATYVTNDSSVDIHVDWMDGPADILIPPGSSSSDEYYNHPDERIRTVVKSDDGYPQGLGVFVVGNDRSAVVVDAGETAIDVYRTRYGSTRSKESFLGRIYYS